MLIYILKSAACLTILLFFYKMFLEKENMHFFKRFYLLGSLVFALVIPTIVFTEYVEVAPTAIGIDREVAVPNTNLNVPTKLESDVLDIAPLLWGVYFLGMLFFGIKFLKNLFEIFRRIRRNPKYQKSNFIQVLLQEKMPPHTFLRYIFLNKQKFESNKIPKEVLLHEETHAREKHSLDVLFVELLQVLFWVNPLVYFFKKAIKLNHEFLADRAVLQKDVDTLAYQNTLLSFLSSESAKKYQPSLPNAINYSSIKKRFTVMKTHTSRKSILFRGILLLPLLALLILGFTETKLIPKIETVPHVNTPDKLSIVPTRNSNSKRSVKLAGLILDSENLAPLKNVEIRDGEGNLISKSNNKGYYEARFDNLNQEGEIIFEFSLSKDGYQLLPQKEHWGNLRGSIESLVYFGLRKNGSSAPEFSDFVSRAKNPSYESILERFPEVKSRFEIRKKIAEAKKGNQLIYFEINDTHYLASNTGLINVNSKDDPILINDQQIVKASKLNRTIKRNEITGMTPLSKGKALYAIYTTPSGIPQKIQEGATEEQVAEYNALATQYNTMIAEEESIWLKKDDVERLEYLYGLMSEEQRANAEPFPDFPEPPPPPEAPAAVEVMTEIESPEPPSAPDEIDVDVPEAPNPPNEVTVEQDPEIPSDFPSPPNLAYRVDQKPMSKKLKKLVDKFSRAKESYLNAVNEYRTEGEGDKDAVIAKYEKLVEVYDQYKEMAAEEGVLAHPVPAYSSIAPSDGKKVQKPKAMFGVKVTPEKAAQQVRESLEKSNKSGKLIEVPELPTRLTTPPAPPEPKSPLEFIDEMNDKNALFFYGDKEISYDEAKDLLKKSDKLSLEARHTGLKRPIVKLSDGPIHIKTHN